MNLIKNLEVGQISLSDLTSFLSKKEALWVLKECRFLWVVVKSSRQNLVWLA